ncbi:thioredoxin-disulfide reductase [Hymenobacter crusticola]|uniref:Thioredoxin reductase n=1 Tax=Hymenobacter crusticola TaxID=1770526 RepID=A0A243WJ00_9BACT|nr:thioredoxin-disulfide reductase [Hymenobacter crusticola]OUJ74979.1 thioredoxin-disulfide reductase [Hymenobacter crusticola]
METTPEHVKCLIIGSGPAGYTAAIYAARANMKPVMYQGLQPGGQLTITNDVENFPGYPTGVMGPEMMEDLKKQAERFGTDIRYGLATAVEFSGHPHKVTIDERKEITADTVIIATGASAKWLGLESEARLNGSGVSACAVCDGFFYRGQEVAIVGAGDTAAEEATYLSNLCAKVYMIVRKGEMRASKIMQKRVVDNPKIEVLWNSVTDEILGEHAVEAVRVKNTLNHETRDIPVKGFFVAIGHEPNSKIFQPYLHHDEQGYLKTIPGSAKTNVDGVFACGDVQDYTYRQAVTAAGSGCMAALDAERYLAALGEH